MTAIDYSGVFAAVSTPFTADGTEVDIEAIDALVAFAAEGGVQGIVPGGSTGEFPTMTTGERKAANAAFIEAARRHDVLVFAGTGALSTAETIDLTRHAESCGADGVMIVAPFYDAPTFEAVLAHLQAVSEASALPIMYYNLPSHTGIDLSIEQLVQLARETNVDVIKDTEGDLVKFNTLLDQHSDDVTMLCGFDGLNFAALALGAVGTVWGMAAFAPRLASDFYRVLAVAKDLDRARAMWKTILPVCDGLESGHYAAGVKAGLELVGHGAGPVRAPVQAVTGAEREAFRQLLVDAGVELA